MDYLIICNKLRIGHFEPHEGTPWHKTNHLIDKIYKRKKMSKVCVAKGSYRTLVGMFLFLTL